MSAPTFIIQERAVAEFSALVHLELPDGAVDLDLTFSQWGGWGCDATDAFGDRVDAASLAASLGYASADLLFTDLTDGLFVCAFTVRGVLPAAEVAR